MVYKKAKQLGILALTLLFLLGIMVVPVAAAQGETASEDTAAAKSVPSSIAPSTAPSDGGKESSALQSAPPPHLCPHRRLRG